MDSKEKEKERKSGDAPTDLLTVIYTDYDATSIHYGLGGISFRHLMLTVFLDYSTLFYGGYHLPTKTHLIHYQ